MTRTAETDGDDHIGDLTHQVLFTNPGERLNRPDLGRGLQQMVFEPNSDALSTATQVLVQGQLQRWLGDVIQVEQLEVQAQEEDFLLTVVYTTRNTGEQHQQVMRIQHRDVERADAERGR